MIFTASPDGYLTWAEVSARCALGRSGTTLAHAKREGDGGSPRGIWPFRRILYRPDRLAQPATGLVCQALSPQDGWCDAPHDLAYNQPVTLPYPASAEALWREDHVYDLIVVLGHNDHPVVPLMGSAIFLHLARSDYAPTEGCVALALPDMLALLAVAGPGDALAIV